MDISWLHWRWKLGELNFQETRTGRNCPLSRVRPFNFAARHRNFTGEKQAIPTTTGDLRKNYGIARRMHFEFRNLEFVPCARETNAGEILVIGPCSSHAHQESTSDCSNSFFSGLRYYWDMLDCYSWWVGCVSAKLNGRTLGNEPEQKKVDTKGLRDHLSDFPA